MRGFIEVTAKGKRTTVKAEAILRLVEEHKGTCIFLEGGTLFEAEESYDEIMARLRRASVTTIRLTSANGAIFVRADAVIAVDPHSGGSKLFFGQALVSLVRETPEEVASLIRGE